MAGHSICGALTKKEQCTQPYKNVLDAVEEYFRTLVQRKKEDKLFELERFMAQVYEENGRCEAAEVAALCLANLYNSGGHRKITPDEYETIKKYLQKFPESAITYHSIPSINTPINPSSNPSSPPP